ncbi:MAG: glutamate--tRNA ligase [Oscillospiraceae bacterium]|nr:glutamate--tRNA ligase [Oscillospiraceae bacterium]MDD4367479.1 glutamate--tRNA ligase [Oscillospiraceae bacterium]
MMDLVVRTRFAPSPTGFMHIGNLRTALYEYLVARSMHGRFILRIEDTDQERLVPGAVDLIYQTLEACGINHDEGPDIGGPYGPYIQSERKAVYQDIALQLVSEGKAYRCFCTEERLASLKAEGEKSHRFGGYDRHCRHLSQAEIESKLSQGQPYVIRQKMPLTGHTSFDDEVFGHIEVPNEELEDQILLKSDGYPTYNFANVVDDHAMAITHVVRGSEYLSSTPKYNLLYQALGYPIPTYIHLPLILGEDGQKLSKRHGATSFADLVQEGFLPEAIINYIALLGWAPKDNREVFSLAELTQVFDVAGISKSPAVFDYNKLKWFNQEYIRRMPLAQLTQSCHPYFARSLNGLPTDEPYLAALLQPRLETFTEIPEKIKFLGHYEQDFELTLFEHKKMKTNLALSLQMLDTVLPELAALQPWDEANLHQYLMERAASLGVKNGQLMWPVRIAASGQAVTPGGAVEVLYLLGQPEALRRMTLARDRLKQALGTQA